MEFEKDIFTLTSPAMQPPLPCLMSTSWFESRLAGLCATLQAKRGIPHPCSY